MFKKAFLISSAIFFVPASFASTQILDLDAEIDEIEASERSSIEKIFQALKFIEENAQSVLHTPSVAAMYSLTFKEQEVLQQYVSDGRKYSDHEKLADGVYALIDCGKKKPDSPKNFMGDDVQMIAKNYYCKLVHRRPYYRANCLSRIDAQCAVTNRPFPGGCAYGEEN